ncbi:hypothetical protein [Aeromonas veronii]|uniref:hypothetical protein n=1 Tax=Aeromonas veronii TaxID=654 RepID=UPI00330E98E4|nr:hypothetical protein [Aeromonas veronii]
MSKETEDRRFDKLQGFIRDAKSIESRIDVLLAASKAEEAGKVAALKTKETSATEDTAKQADKPAFWQD